MRSNLKLGLSWLKCRLTWAVYPGPTGQEWLAGHGTQILSVSFDPDGRRFAFAATGLHRLGVYDLGQPLTVGELVVRRAKLAWAAGVRGFVASPHEASRIRAQLPDAYIVTPGIRPTAAGDDQKRTVDVAQAFANGADYIVVGRPIRQAPDPRAAAEAIQATIASIFPA